MFLCFSNLIRQMICRNLHIFTKFHRFSIPLIPEKSCQHFAIFILICIQKLLTDSLRLLQCLLFIRFLSLLFRTFIQQTCHYKNK